MTRIIEKKCLYCNKTFPRKEMKKTSKTNSFGDKTVKGWICRECWEKDLLKRNKMLLITGIFFLIIGIVLFLSIPGLLELRFYNHYYADLPVDYLPYIIVGSLLTVVGVSFTFLWYKNLKKINEDRLFPKI